MFTPSDVKARLLQNKALAKTQLKSTLTHKYEVKDQIHDFFQYLKRQNKKMFNKQLKMRIRGNTLETPKIEERSPSPDAQTGGENHSMAIKEVDGLTEQMKLDLSAVIGTPMDKSDVIGDELKAIREQYHALAAKNSDLNRQKVDLIRLKNTETP